MPTLSQLDANQVLRAAYDDNNEGLKIQDGSSLVPESFDEQVLGYSGSDLTTIVYKSSSVTVATITLTYDAPGGNIINVKRT